MRGILPLIKVMETTPLWAMMLILLSCPFGSKSIAPATSPPPAGDWTVKDSKGNICMRMQFAAQYIVSTDYWNPPKRVVIDPAYATVKSRCESPKRLLTIYPNTEEEKEMWYLQLTFTNESHKFNLTKIEASWLDPSTGVGLGEETTSNNFMDIPVTIGEAYNCSQPIVGKMRNANVTMWDMHLQPFAEASGGEFGPSETCPPRPTVLSFTPIIPLTAPPPAGNWTVRNSKGKVCMRLHLAAQYVVGTSYFNPPRHVAMYPALATVWSRCDSPVRILYMYPNDEEGGDLWSLQLTFTKSTYTYTLTEITAFWGSLGESRDSPNFMERCVAIGESYSCDRPIFVPMRYVNVTIWDMHLQPFAEDTDGEFGPSSSCTNPPVKNCNAAPTPAVTMVTAEKLTATTPMKTTKRPHPTTTPMSIATKSTQPMSTAKNSTQPMSTAKQSTATAHPTTASPVNVPLIVGAVVGGVVLLGIICIIIGVIVFVIKRKHDGMNYVLL